MATATSPSAATGKDVATSRADGYGRSLVTANLAALRMADVELMRDSARTVAPSDAVAPSVPEALDLTEPQEIGPGDQAVGLLAFDVEEG